MAGGGDHGHLVVTAVVGVHQVRGGVGGGHGRQAGAVQFGQKGLHGGGDFAVMKGITGGDDLPVGRQRGQGHGHRADIKAENQ